MNRLATIATGWALALAAPAYAQLATVTTLDAAGDVGRYVSLAMGADQRGLISYYDVTNLDLKVAHCSDVACTSATLTPLDSAGDVGRHTAIAIGQDGLGVISYVDATNATLKVAHCTNVACTSATVRTVDTGATGGAGQGTDIAIGNDGLPLIVYRGNDQLRVVHCGDAACTSATGMTFPSQPGRNPTVTSTAGLPLIASDTGQVLTVGRCHDTACTSATLIPIDFFPGSSEPEGVTPIRATYDASLARGPDGRGVLVYTLQQGSIALPTYSGQFRRCADDGCTALSAAVGFSAGFALFGNADVAVGADGRPTLVATGLSTEYYLGVSSCSVPGCQGSAPDIVDGPGAGLFPSIAYGANGRPLIAYQAGVAGDLKVAYLGGDPVADLAAHLEDSPDPIAPSQTLTYRMRTTNLGPNVAHGVSTSVVLPAGVAFTGGSAGCFFDSTSRTVTCAGPDVPVNALALLGTVTVVVPTGLTGPLTATATVTAATTDPDPTSNSATTTTATAPGLRITQPQVVEGNAGLRDAGIVVDLLSDGTPPPSVTVAYQTAPLTAQSGVDYLPASGTLTFTPATSASQPVAVSVVGDTTMESSESFALLLTNAQGAVPITNTQGTIIVDDDGVAGAQAALAHGSSLTGTLLPAGSLSPSVLYRVEAPAHGSMEIVVDAVSGDVLPLSLQLLASNGTVLEEGQPVGTGSSLSLRFDNVSFVPILNRSVRVLSGGCGDDCGPDDVFRIRAYETTARVPRFNNSGSQFTILVLQNPSAAPVAAIVWFWDATGTRITDRAVSIPPRGTAVVDTSSTQGRSGSITITHDAPYGVLQGKAVALEPSTGFSFDTPLTYRPR